MNLPNAISLSRLVLTAVFVAGTAFDSAAGHWIALVSFVIAAISDFVDGWLARKLGLVTPMGKLLDPVADKVLVCSAFVYLSTRSEVDCPVWVTVLILAREFLVTGLRQIAVEAGQVIGRRPFGEMENRMATDVLHHLSGLVCDTTARIGESVGGVAPLSIASRRVAATRRDVVGPGADAAFRMELHVDQSGSVARQVRLDRRKGGAGCLPLGDEGRPESVSDTPLILVLAP